MLNQENEKLSLKRKIVLSIGLLVAAMILIFSQYSGIKAKPDYDVKQKNFEEKNIKSNLNKIKNLKKFDPDSIKLQGENKKIRSSKTLLNDLNTIKGDLNQFNYMLTLS